MYVALTYIPGGGLLTGELEDGECAANDPFSDCFFPSFSRLVMSALFRASATGVVLATGHGAPTITAERRYRQFDVLDKTLRAAFQGVPDLPGKAGWLSSSDKDFLDKRKAGLSSYLRSITLDPALSQNEDVRSFLELGSAEELFVRLQEKEHFCNLAVLEKDKALEAQRQRVAALTGENGRAQHDIQALEAQIAEAARGREEAKAAADAALGLARQQVGQLEEAVLAAQAAEAEAVDTRRATAQRLEDESRKQQLQAATREAQALRAELASSAAEGAALRRELSNRKEELHRATARADALREEALGSLDARVVACVRKEEGPRWWWAYQAFAETRRAALDEYLQGLVGDAGLRTSLSLQAFLELGALVGRNAVLSPAPSPSMRARSSNT
ncbi:hypothetical protein EMIHUDRAFT_451995 [Emiliania huxleyi CCMP1516]|uniref:PX domain-containing protein n=2 Tax=Emiliania huxleyi TaxID=2903 RepID=A0A0D3IQP8_EMIH1|nr:hypothetical protein EMIHUDRAFT_451995 [Emiliania huxleyi CCMP1516]EOD13583.1 hypothetical protein EMIHUDRAFT_451995 [Emiliania huxleyi CCMP1516]|eukprot:XP_005766012.1 hypothetical protein EMIHUDRAFT_451995 [Emiliania huxleyi CCMP1516]